MFNIRPYLRLNLRLFDVDLNVQTTKSPGLTDGMKTYYEDRLIDYAEPQLVHDQFGDEYNIPKHGGKIIEFRKYLPLPKALNQLIEGVTPKGGKLEMSTLTAEVGQYGYYITISDILELAHIDPQLEQATKLLGSQAGRTLDTITRDIITAGTNVSYAPKVSAAGAETEVLSRADLDDTALLTTRVIFKAAAKLRRMNAVPIDDCYVAIVHPNVACDLMLSDGWLDVHKYAQPENIYKGEIGKLGGVRFAESTEARIIGPAAISDGLGVLSVKTAINSSSTSIVINEELTEATPAEPIPVYINGAENTITAIATSGGNTTLTVGTAIASLAAGAKITGKGATKSGKAVYCTMFIAQNAYGRTMLKGGGLRHIIKQLGSGGTADPLDQRATTGWKATKVAERLVEEYMVRVEHCSETEPYAAAN